MFTMHRQVSLRWVMVAVALGCGSAAGESSPSASDGGVEGGASGDAGHPSPEAGFSADAGATGDAGPATATADTRVLHTEHRAVPGKMFGGWGPHLGHLLRRNAAGLSQLYFADDACGLGMPCDVNSDGRLDYFRLDGAAWTRIGTLALPAGIQQNVASILVGDTIYSYGVNVVTHALTECSFQVITLQSACTSAAVGLPLTANYVGAAVTPSGYRMAWYTNAVDGGGGDFEYFANYGGGWNGPRRGSIGGYNDVSYINIAFGVDGVKESFTMHGQLVSGLAPNWDFFGAIANGNSQQADALTWSMALAGPAAGDPIVSTDDVVVDARTGDTHLIGRSKLGSAVYYFRPRGGSFGAPVYVFAQAFRARLVPLASGAMVLARSDEVAGGIKLYTAPASRPAGVAIDWAAAAVFAPQLPPEYAKIYAIYPEADAYALAPRATLELALVGSVRENEVLHLSARHVGE